MKKKGKMAACLILLVLLLAVLVVLTKKNSTADADSGSSNSGADAEKVVDFSKDDVTALSFQIDGETVSFTKTAGDDDTDIWTYDQEDGFPLDEGKITNVLSSLSSMTAERVIEGDEIDSMADFGLETPSQEVVVTAGDEKTTIHVGDKNSSSRYYIYLNDDTSKVYLVSTSLGTMFPSDMMEWATTESMPSVTAENITKLQVEGENGYTLTKEVSAADSALQTDEWQVVDADGAAHGGDADSIGTMTSAVASLSFGDLVTYNASDLSQYGLDQPKTTIRVHYTEEQEVEADDTTTADTSSDSTTDSASSDSTATSSSSETTTVTVEKDLVLYVGNANEDGGSYYVKLDGSNEVHLMTASNVETFTGKKASDFWNMYIGMENVSDLTSLDITYNGETKTYVRHVEEKKDDDSDSTTQEISYICGDETIDKSTFTTFYSSLIGLKAQTKDESLVQAKDAEFTAVFHMTDGDLTFAYSPYDSSFYYTVDEDGVPSLVNKNNVKTMVENYDALLAAKTEDDSSSDSAEERVIKGWLKLKTEDLLRVKKSVNPPFFFVSFFRSRPGAEGGITVPGRKRSGSGLRGPAGPPSAACALFSAGSGFRWRC